MHKTLTLKVAFNKLSDGTSEQLIINKVHEILHKDLAPHGFTGVQKIPNEMRIANEAPPVATSEIPGLAAAEKTAK